MPRPATGANGQPADAPPASRLDSPLAFQPDAPLASPPDAPPASRLDSPLAFQPDSPPASRLESPLAFQPDSPPASPPDSPPASRRWGLAAGITARATGVADGDMAAGREGVEIRRRAVVDLPWSSPRQVHGARVVAVDEPGAGCDCEADALVTDRAGLAIAVVTADCAPVALASPEGVAGVAHAGWRGLEAGVVQATVAAMRRLGATTVTAVLGPCIHAECYEFGAADLDRIAGRLGPTVRARHAGGGPALDVPAGVAAALAESGARLVGDADVCTACSDGHWSWRRDADRRRQAMVVWRP